MGSDDELSDPEGTGHGYPGAVEPRCEVCLKGVELRVVGEIGELVKNWYVVKKVGHIKELHIKLGTGCWLVLK